MHAVYPLEQRPLTAQRDLQCAPTALNRGRRAVFSCQGNLRELRGRRADRDGQSRACAAETNAATLQRRLNLCRRDGPCVHSALPDRRCTRSKPNRDWSGTPPIPARGGVKNPSTTSSASTRPVLVTLIVYSTIAASWLPPPTVRLRACCTDGCARETVHMSICREASAALATTNPWTFTCSKSHGQMPFRKRSQELSRSTLPARSCIRTSSTRGQSRTERRAFPCKTDGSGLASRTEASCSVRGACPCRTR